eukprot:COSAG01_NODE_9521_length_2421_cov_9.437123_1_plen_268_part_00
MPCGRHVTVGRASAQATLHARINPSTPTHCTTQLAHREENRIAGGAMVDSNSGSTGQQGSTIWCHMATCATASAATSRDSPGAGGGHSRGGVVVCSAPSGQELLAALPPPRTLKHHTAANILGSRRRRRHTPSTAWDRLACLQTTARLFTACMFLHPKAHTHTHTHTHAEREGGGGGGGSRNCSEDVRGSTQRRGCGGGQHTEGQGALGGLSSAQCEEAEGSAVQSDEAAALCGGADVRIEGAVMLGLSELEHWAQKRELLPPHDGV